MYSSGPGTGEHTYEQAMLESIREEQDKINKKIDKIDKRLIEIKKILIKDFDWEEKP